MNKLVAKVDLCREHSIRIDHPVPYQGLFQGLTNEWTSYFQLLTFAWTILPKKNNNNKCFCCSKNNNQLISLISITAEFIVIAICGVLLGLELEKNPSAISIISAISHQAKTKNTCFHVSGQTIFFSNYAAGLIYKLTKFTVSFLCLRYGPPPSSYCFTLILYA